MQKLFKQQIYIMKHFSAVINHFYFDLAERSDYFAVVKVPAIIKNFVYQRYQIIHTVHFLQAPWII